MPRKLSDPQFTRVQNSLYKTRKTRVEISYLRVKNLETPKNCELIFFRKIRSFPVLSISLVKNSVFRSPF